MNDEFLNYIRKEIRPFLNDCVREDTFRGYDGTPLSCYYALHPQEKAAVVIVHGFCEFFGKYHEVMYRFYQEGYSVFFMELRGHGKSGRPRNQKDQRVSIQTFGDYTEDVRFFIQEFVSRKCTSGDILLLGHSMGGLVSALLLEKYPFLVQRAVLTSPLLKINFGKVPEWAINALSVYTRIAGNGEEYAPGQHAFDGEYAFEDSSYLDRDRYEYQFVQRLNDPAYQTWGGTWSWVKAATEGTEEVLKNADKIKVPVLILQAGKDKLVRAEGQVALKEKSPYVELKIFPESKHEIFNATKEMREDWYRTVFNFFQSGSGDA